MEKHARTVLGLGVFTLLVLVPLGTVLRGLAIALLWGWFIVPLGVPPVAFWGAIGLGVLASLFVGTRAPTDEETDKAAEMIKRGFIPSAWHVTVKMLMPIAVALAMGWLVATLGGIS